MSDPVENSCPICDSELENGFVYRRPGGAIELGDFRLGWFTGDAPPTRGWYSDWQPLDPLGESHGVKGSFVAGKRCTSCRKIILDY